MLTLRRLDKEVAFVSYRVAFFFFYIPETEISGFADIPRAVERREDRVPVLSLLPTGCLALPFLGVSRESYGKCLSVVLPRSLRMCYAFGAPSPASRGISA